jgi:Multiple resistance and pH regulation protein F (MrpF / PhaF).
MSWVDVLLVVLGAVMAVVIGRLLTGPANADRVVALDLGFVVFIAATALLSIRLDVVAVDILVLAATLLGFLTTIAVSHLLERRPR